MPPRLTFKFVRHGETKENREKVLLGHSDRPLNLLGRRQAAAVAVALQDAPFTYAFASDLSRAVDTAEAILQYHQISLVKEQRIREKSFGDAEGLPVGTKVRNSGETFGQLRKRARGWWKETVANIMEDNITDEDKVIYVLVVSHGGFIRCLLQTLISDAEFSFASTVEGEKLGSLRNTAVSTVEAVAANNGCLISYCDDSHLRDVRDDEEDTEGRKGTALNTESG